MFRHGRSKGWQPPLPTKHTGMRVHRQYEQNANRQPVVDFREQPVSGTLPFSSRFMIHIGQRGDAWRRTGRYQTSISAIVLWVMADDLTPRQEAFARGLAEAAPEAMPASRPGIQREGTN